MSDGGTGGTPTTAADFTGFTGDRSGTLDFAATDTGAALTRTFDVAINDDAAGEPDTETFTVTLTSSDTAVLAIDATAGSVETAITDDDVPVASISGPATVGEDAGALTGAQPGGTAITVTLDRSPVRAVVVAYGFGGTATGAVVGTAAAATADYTYPAPPNSVTFAAGASGTALTREIPVTIFYDTTDAGTGRDPERRVLAGRDGEGACAGRDGGRGGETRRWLTTPPKP